MEQLNKIKEALINAGKKVLIQITDDIVKIIVGDSAGSSYSGLEKRGITDSEQIELIYRFGKLDNTKART